MNDTASLKQVRSQRTHSNSCETQIAVVIPAYRVAGHVLGVIAAIGPECTHVYVVDDACPERSGDIVEQGCRDPRVRVLRHVKNRGVGGAVMTGYQQAVADGAKVIVKVDGDGQMDPRLLPRFVAPILRGEADYTKGNRFFDLRHIKQMPLIRRLGNLALSFISKASTGYWDVFDPNNGYTAIHGDVAALLPTDAISERYFFETDMLFRLNTLRAVVVDIPMDARYGDEVSNLRITDIFGEFLGKHMRNLSKRLLYNYYLRDLSIASLELIAGLGLLLFGSAFGIFAWRESIQSGVAATVGTVMVPTLAIMLGLQLVLAFLAYDIANLPRYPLHHRLR